MDDLESGKTDCRVASLLAMTAFGQENEVTAVAFPLGGPNSPRTSRDLGPPGTPRGGGSHSETDEELAERGNKIGC